MDDNKDDVKHMIPEDDVINLHDLLAHSAPTRSPEEFERSTEDVELEADEKKVPVLGEEFISHHDVVASSSSKRHTEVKINEEGTYRYVVGRPNMSGPSTSSNYYGQIVNNVNTGQRIDPALRGNSHHTVSRCASSSSTAGRSQAPPTFYCTLCRSNIPSAIYQLVVPSDLVPKEALRQLLLTKYGSSVVDEALKGDHPVLICRRHVENETESASSTFFCTLCRSHIPSSVNQLIVTPGVKPNLRRILQNKFSACQVEEALKGEEQLLICRRHVEEEIDPSPSTFFCALCRLDIPTTVPQLIVSPDPAYKATIRQLLLQKYSQTQVEEALSCDKQVLICRSHAEMKISSVLETPSPDARRQIGLVHVRVGSPSAGAYVLDRELMHRVKRTEIRMARRSEECVGKVLEKQLTTEMTEEVAQRMEERLLRADRRRRERAKEREMLLAMIEAQKDDAVKEREAAEKEERRVLEREKARIRRQREDPEQRAVRLQKCAEQRRLRPRIQSAEERQRNSERSRRRWAGMDQVQKEEFRKQKAERERLRKMNETEEERERLRQRRRLYEERRLKTEEQRVRKKERAKAYYSNEENRQRNNEAQRANYLKRKQRRLDHENSKQENLV